MDCPKCHSAEFSTAVSCPDCGFSADGRSLIHFANLTFVLAEMVDWDIPAAYINPLRQSYTDRLKTCEIDLGLRLPPPDAAEALALYQHRAQILALDAALVRWAAQDCLATTIVDQMRDQISGEVVLIDQLLADAPPVWPSQTAQEYALRRLAEEHAILEAAQELHTAGHLSASSLEIIAAERQVVIEQAEIRAGLRPPEPISQTQIREKQPPTEEEFVVKPPKAPRWQRPSLSWDRVWESLLSERTLHVVLFLGVLLLLASGASWVVWNWDTFPPLAQIAFLGSFTAGFYLLGWYVRTQLKLEGSGIALIAVASLLIPLDFYAFYISGGLPGHSWPTVWLAASFVCLIAYGVTAVLLQATFFGYLVALAGVSLALAGLNLLGLPVVWWQTAVVAAAFVLALLTEGGRWISERLRFLLAPFGQMALILTAPVLVVGLVWGVWAGSANIAYYAALAASWWIGGLTLLIMTRRYRMQTLVWVTALCFPVAVWLAQRVLMTLWPVDVAWYALGWLLLAPFYLGAAVLLQRWDTSHDDEFLAMARKTAVTLGVLLAILAALWSLQDGRAATAVHLLLAVGAALAAWFSQQGRLWWAMSLFLTIAAAAWQASRGAGPVELALPWALLAVLHLLAALSLRPRLAPKQGAFLSPLFGAAVLLAGLAIVPPLILFDQALLVYALGNWLVINAWLAALDHQQTPGLSHLLAEARWRRLRPALFHWLTALPLPAWVWLLWTMGRSPSVELGLLFAVLAFGLMVLTAALRRLRWDYGLPWRIGSLAAILLALGLAFGRGEPAVGVMVLWATAVYFLTAVRVFYSPRYFYAAGLLFPLAWMYVQEAVDVDWRAWSACLGLFPLVYVLAGMWLEKRRGHERPFTRPFYHMALFVSLPAMLFSLGQAIGDWETPVMAWSALTPGALAVAAACYAWLTNRQRWAYSSVWLATLAGGLMVVTFSRGSGRSAALVAVMAAVYVLAERWLHMVARRPKRAWGWQALDVRAVWLLYRRPLLFTGWLLSAAAIGMALVRNMWLLGGGRTREAWSIAALVIIVGLYALSARLFRQPRLALLASGLAIAPWTLAVHLFWGDVGAWFGASWVVLALGQLGVGALLTVRLNARAYGLPPQLVAHGLAIVGLMTGVLDPAVSSVSVGLVILFYLGAAALDRADGGKARPGFATRFVFPLAGLLPLWAIYLCLWLWPGTEPAVLGLVAWAFVLPLLTIGRRLARWEPAYRWPFYLSALSWALVALGVAVLDWQILTAVLFLNSGAAVLCVWLFREPLWWYPATVLLPAGVWTLLAQIRGSEPRHYGWSLIGLAGLYLAGAWALRRANLRRYETPLLAMTFVLVAAGLPLCSTEKVDAFVGYGLAALILTAAALWLRRPLPFSFAVGLAVVPYWVAVSWLNLSTVNAGLLAWPGIAAALGLAYLLDAKWAAPLDAFPWKRPLAWLTAVWQRWTRWWALALYVVAGLNVAASAWLTLDSPWRLMVMLAAGTAVFFWWTLRFHLRGWLLVAGVWGQLAALAFIRLVGWTETGAQVALAFAPVTAVALFLAFLVEQGRLEKPLLSRADGRWRLSLGGWSLPFYLLLLGDLVFGLGLTLDLGWQSAVATLLYALVVGVLAQHWQLKALGYLTVGLSLAALAQRLLWLESPPEVWPQALAVWSLVVGAAGYGLRRWARDDEAAPGWIQVWERPLVRGGWAASLLALGLAGVIGGGLGTAVPQIVLFGGGLTLYQTAAAQMLIRTFALLGLFYLTAALAENRPRLSYLALLLLFAAWSLWLLAIQGARELQLYAIPAGFYLLLLGWLEWQRGSQAAGRWLDWTAVIVLFGSALSQSFGNHGELYALLMIGEGLLLAWMGSLRRLRRLLYLGVAGVVTAVGGQLIEPLLALNTLVLLLLGAALVALGIALERRLDKVRDLSRELRLKMEHWE